MIKDIHNITSRLWPRFCEKLTHNLHDLGIAIVPLLCEKVLIVAVIVAAIFILLTAVQVVMMEAL